MIRKFIEKRKIKRAFEKLVAPEHVEEVLRDGFRPTECRHGRVEFIVTFIRGESPDELSKHIGRIADIATTHGATFHHMIGALVIVAFGTHPTSVPKPGNRLLLVQSLQQELADAVKIVHGAADGHYGLFGGETLLSYTGMWFVKVSGKFDFIR